MNVFFCLLFIAAQGLLSFVAADRLSKMQHLLLMAAPAACFVLLIYSFPHLSPLLGGGALSDTVETMFYQAEVSLTVFIMMHFFNAFIIPGMIKSVVKGNIAINPEGMQKKPMRTLVSLADRGTIALIYRIFFFFGSILAYYGIWLGKTDY